ncbi:hypothetical protein [Maricaulis parjimensis]|uniref:hypothetical protein n=1 Tax=Maricaulis parjimensis TaxID=144023 RepID=UPI00193A945F|nr:hypothetical protein [Maricaulis parjimensis]
MGRTYSLTDTTRDTELMGGSGRGAWELACFLDGSDDPAKHVPLLMDADYHGHNGVEIGPRPISAAELKDETGRLVEILTAMDPDHAFGPSRAKDWAEFFAAVNVYATAHPDSQFCSAFSE